MTQENTWDREYGSQTFLTNDSKPQADILRFVRFLKDKKVLIDGVNVLDLGSGAGRNSLYFAELGASVTGLEISSVAIDIAQKHLSNARRGDSALDINFIHQSIGEIFPLDTDSVDIALDITSSNSLTENERQVYLSETHRTLKKCQKQKSSSVCGHDLTSPLCTKLFSKFCISKRKQATPE